MKTLSKWAAGLSLASASLFNAAFAAIDVAGVNTAIGVAETSAHTVGTTVIGVIAGLAVVTIVISLVKKM